MVSPNSSNSAHRKSKSTRKRALGIGLIVAAPFLSSFAAASPFRQHRVTRPQRHVAYQHVIDNRIRDLPSRFTFSGGEDEKLNNNLGPAAGPSKSSEPSSAADSQQRGAKLEFWKDESGGHHVWSFVADASRDHPLRTKSTTATTSVEEEEGNSARRRDQVVEKFVEDSTSAVLQDETEDSESSTTGSQGTGAAEDGESTENIHENYEAFNVTAEVLYNVSEPESTNGDVSAGPVGGDVATVLTSSHKLPDNRSSTTAQSTYQYQPLRIRAILSQQRDGGEFLTFRGREYLMHEIMRPALLTWSAALRVEPVVGNLTVDENQLFDNQTCGPGLDSGLPSPQVPSYHLKEGMPDTDMILYLSIGFVPDALKLSAFIDNTTFDIDSIDPSLFNSSTESSDVDFDDGEQKPYLEWTRAPTESPSRPEKGRFPRSGSLPSSGPQPMLCEGSYVAAASYCSTDQYDRPTAAMLHLCIDETFFSNSTRNSKIVTVMHEVGHALGFNSRSMAHFRRPDGSPVTPRRVDGEIAETEVECTGPTSARRYANVTLPSEEIVQFRRVRGGVRVAEVVTPSVLQVVRNHFDCQELSGAELESGEYSPLAGDPDEQACIGDHWERRLFRNDLLNPVVDEVEYTPFISTITLAYFADSGWYQVDLSMAELAASWGRGAGCSFVEETCIGNDGQVSQNNKPFFCNAVPKETRPGTLAEPQIDGCTSDLSRKATCRLGQYDQELPPEYQYFGLSYGGTVGGVDPFIDYCPTYAGFDNGLCSSKENAAVVKVNQIERFGSRNSRCLSGVVQTRNTALCLPIACVVEDRSLHIKVGGTWRRCESKDYELEILEEEEGDVVVCPDPRRVCPTFYCHHDCLGTNGRCDYDSGACVCSNSSETSDGVASDGILGCRQNQTFDADGNYSVSFMPHENSPLSDYYFPLNSSLQDDSNMLLNTWQIILLTVLVLALAVATFWYFRLRGGGEIATNGGDDGDQAGADGSPNPNKHKMIASVLVDMRINSNEAPSVAPTDETAASLCGLESAADSSLCASSLDDRASVASEELLEDVEAHDAKRKCSMRKRRLKGHF